MALKYLLSLFFVVVIAGCNSQSTQPVQQSTINATPRINSQQYIEQTATQLFLRGSFNLWDYHSEYQLLQVHGRTFAASATLTKGKRYEFMFSAKDASQPYSNCGYQKQQLIVSNQKYHATCNNIVQENFIFIPNHSGVYEFFLQLESINHPMVYIKKAY